MTNVTAGGRMLGRTTWSRRVGNFSIWAFFALATVLVGWPMARSVYYQVVAKPPVSAVAWRTDFDAALAESKSSGKPLLLDFGASWCPPCRIMEHEVWPDRGVGSAVTGRYIPVRLDVDDPKAGPLAARYEVDGIPAVLVVDGTGRPLRRAGFMSSAETISFLSGREGTTRRD